VIFATRAFGCGRIFQDDVIKYLYKVTSNNLNLSVPDIFQKRVLRTKLYIYVLLNYSVNT